MTAQARTVKDVLELGAGFLAGKSIPEARLKCELLAARLLTCKRLDLYLRFDEVLSEAHLAAMRRGVKRLADGEPIQYIVGETGFLDHTLKTDARALIPRPETEGLVETVLAAGLPDDALVVDVGTGSGCIAVSFALARGNWRCIALDTSTAALELARENAAAKGVDTRVAFVQADLSDCVEPETVNAIVANLPYVPTGEYEKLAGHIRDHEPRAALDGGADGLDTLRSVVPDAAIALQPGGRLFLEIGADQARAVESLLKAEGFASIDVQQDLAGHDRIVTAQIPTG